MYYGVPQIGAILLPINIRLSSKDISYILNDSEAKCLIVNEDMVNLVKNSELTSVEKYILMRYESARSGLRVEGEGMKNY
jgi:fatty-acyl-CoA synthase